VVTRGRHRATQDELCGEQASAGDAARSDAAEQQGRRDPSDRLEVDGDRREGRVARTSSQPMTEISSGTSTPSWARPPMSPWAMVSSKARTAVACAAATRSASAWAAS